MNPDTNQCHVLTSFNSGAMLECRQYLSRCGGIWCRCSTHPCRAARSCDMLQDILCTTARCQFHHELSASAPARPHRLSCSLELESTHLCCGWRLRDVDITHIGEVMVIKPLLSCGTVYHCRARLETSALSVLFSVLRLPLVESKKILSRAYIL